MDRNLYDRRFVITLIICIAIAATLVMGYLIGSRIWLLGSLLTFLLSIIFTKQQYKLIFLVFFAPWVYVMKLSTEQTSFYTIGLGVFITVSVIGIIKANKKIPIRLLCSFLFFAGYILLSLYDYESNAVNAVKYITNCFIIVIVAMDYELKQFELYSITYALGLLLSSVVGLFFKAIPQMAYFISYDTLINNGSLYNRFTGLNWDPNYYGMQVLISACLLLVLFSYKRSKYLILMVISLLVFGIYSFSKMYIISLLIMIVVYVYLEMQNNLRKSMKLLLFLFILFSIGLTLKLDTIFSLYGGRFDIGLASGIDGLTTGRSVVWIKYLQLFSSDIKVFLVGEGITTGFKRIIIAPHNLYICIIYWIGIIGMAAYAYFINSFSSHINKINSIKNLSNRLPIIMFIIIFFSLDGFIEEYFSIQLMLIIMALHYGKPQVTTNEDNKDLISNMQINS